MTEVLDRQARYDVMVADPGRETVATRADRPLEDEGLHKIVVVGGGAAGLELVTRLGDRLGRRRRASVALVESARTHLWKPLLHEAVAGSMDPGEYELNYLAQAHWHGFRYRLGEMIGLDRAAKEVHLAATFDDEGRPITPPRSVGYDTLVIAIGSVTNDFGAPGVAQHAVPLETPAQAVRFNRRLVNACIRAETQDGPVRPGQLHVAIVGAGATGAELAAELHRTAREVVAYGLDRIDPERDIRIVLIEAADRILPGLPERISEAARRQLDRIGIEIHTGAKVTEVTADGLRLADGSFIASELVVWAAGRRQSPGGIAARRWSGDQPHQPAGRPADIADHTRFRHLCDRRLRRLSAPGRAHPSAAASTGRAPGGRTYGAPDRATAARRALAALFIPRFRLAGFTRKTQHSGEPDGPPLRPRLLRRGSVCGRDVPRASHAARASIAWYPTRRIGLAGTGSVASYRPAGEAALNGRRRQKER
jgi:NADH dehydrogenase FAD-containing subunit